MDLTIGDGDRWCSIGGGAIEGTVDALIEGKGSDPRGNVGEPIAFLGRDERALGVVTDTRSVMEGGRTRGVVALRWDSSRAEPESPESKGYTLTGGLWAVALLVLTQRGADSEDEAPEHECDPACREVGDGTYEGGWLPPDAGPDTFRLRNGGAPPRYPAEVPSSRRFRSRCSGAGTGAELETLPAPRAGDIALDGGRALTEAAPGVAAVVLELGEASDAGLRSSGLHSGQARGPPMGAGGVC